MAPKQLICLACSRKHGGYCFAGMELSTGLWIRPIGKHENGTLSMTDCCLASGNGTFQLPNLLDVIEIDFVAPEPSRAQSENWRISGAEWKRVRRPEVADLTILMRNITEDPELFRGYERYVSKRDIELRPPNCSLALVRPETLRWRPETDRYGHKRFRGTFTFSGMTYDLPLTDDVYAARLRGNATIDGLSDASIEILLTISLGDLYEDTGRYYKLIAGVVELARS